MAVVRLDGAVIDRRSVRPAGDFWAAARSPTATPGPVLFDWPEREPGGPLGWKPCSSLSVALPMYRASKAAAFCSATASGVLILTTISPCPTGYWQRLPADVRTAMGWLVLVQELVVRLRTRPDAAKILPHPAAEAGSIRNRTTRSAAASCWAPKQPRPRSIPAPMTSPPPVMTSGPRRTSPWWRIGSPRRTPRIRATGTAATTAGRPSSSGSDTHRRETGAHAGRDHRAARHGGCS